MLLGFAEEALLKSTGGQASQRVFRLADSGETTAAISRATRLSEGEVETLLSLRSRR